MIKPSTTRQKQSSLEPLVEGFPATPGRANLIHIAGGVRGRAHLAQEGGARAWVISSHIVEGEALGLVLVPPGQLPFGRCQRLADAYSTGKELGHQHKREQDIHRVG